MCSSRQNEPLSTTCPAEVGGTCFLSRNDADKALRVVGTALRHEQHGRKKRDDGTDDVEYRRTGTASIREGSARSVADCE